MHIRGVVARADVGNLYGAMALFDLQYACPCHYTPTPSECFFLGLISILPLPLRLHATVAAAILFQAFTFGSGLVFHVT